MSIPGAMLVPLYHLGTVHLFFSRLLGTLSALSAHTVGSRTLFRSLQSSIKDNCMLRTIPQKDPHN